MEPAAGGALTRPAFAVPPAVGLLAPGLLVLGLLFVLPIATVATWSLFAGGRIDPAAFDPGAWERLVADDYHLTVGWRTLRLGVAITIATLLLGYPLALLADQAGPRLRTLLILALVLPLMTSVVVRSFGWLVIMGRGGWLSRTLRDLDLAPRGFQLAYTELGVGVALTQVLLPYMVLTLLGVLARTDRRLVEAARAMGAGWFGAMRHVVWPLSLPGVVAGCVLVFALSISSFVTPLLVGGLRLPVLAGSIYQNAIAYADWPLAAAQSVVLFSGVALVLLPWALVARRTAR